MIFTPDLTATESQDGKTVTFTNTSNFSDNDQGYDRNAFTTNKVVLKDAYDALIDEIPFPISGVMMDKVKIQLDKSKWVKAELVMDGPASYSVIKKFPFYKIFIQRFKNILRNGDKDPASSKEFALASYYKDVAEYAIEPGDSVEFQDNIDVAHSYLNNVS